MNQYQVKLYQTSNYKQWNDFVGQAMNATFLFHRDFMEYHQERFEDCSLMVFEGEKIVAIIPANRVGDTVYSHQGLSYGGLVIKELRIKDYLLVLKAVLFFLNSKNILILDLKIIPKIYNQTLCDEIDYAFFVLQSTIYRADAYLVIDMICPYEPNRNRKRALKKATLLQIEIKEELDYTTFWKTILTPNLQERFGVIPVHSYKEIKKLAELFPKNIKLFNAYQGDVLKAGVVIFLMSGVVHFQYSSGGADRTDTAALDILFDYIIQKYADNRYVSFGSSTENGGLKLNSGLAYWKESFGAKTTVQNYYRVETKNYNRLDIPLL
ncbi:GNAT family N-acetyltransferase [Flavobacterium sp. 7A]|uniref:GNAT family N-acetyltransferase n=1 Tax=Flavobacterium sp. 7A TaxID=2940571 RepID=UPI0022267557|nr:GNAT family N-acetyltransferase [Flavobacterium sp. 7A]MCW2119882.1 hypothetical protein [Flavobacterium sp. 7A]